MEFDFGAGEERKRVAYREEKKTGGTPSVWFLFIKLFLICHHYYCLLMVNCVVDNDEKDATEEENPTKNCSPFFEF